MRQSHCLTALGKLPLLLLLRYCHGQFVLLPEARGERSLLQHHLQAKGETEWLVNGDNLKICLQCCGTKELLKGFKQLHAYTHTHEKG